MAQYAALFGPIQQFPDSEAVNVKQLDSGQKVAEFMVRSNWPQQPLVKVSLWPEFAATLAKLAKGVFVAVEGKYTQNTVGERTYHNVSASAISVLTPEIREETAEVVNPVDRTASRAPSF